MKCSREQFNTIINILIKHNFSISYDDLFENSSDNYLVNNYECKSKNIATVPVLSAKNYARRVFNAWNADTFLHYCGITNENIYSSMNKYKNQKVSINDVLKIHEIACSSWKNIIASYLVRCDETQLISFEEHEIDAMFTAATSEQNRLLTNIFRPQNIIDFEKIVVGSLVKLTDNNSHLVYNFDKIDYSKPFYVLAYKVPFCVTSERVHKTGYHPLYNMFYQDGNVITFNASNDIDYIVEVIKY